MSHCRDVHGSYLTVTRLPIWKRASLCLSKHLHTNIWPHFESTRHSVHETPYAPGNLTKRACPCVHVGWRRCSGHTTQHGNSSRHQETTVSSGAAAEIFLLLLMLVLLPVADQTALPIRWPRRQQSVENRETAAAPSLKLKDHPSSKSPFPSVGKRRANRQGRAPRSAASARAEQIE
jgi:hypothetical protein